MSEHLQPAENSAKPTFDFIAIGGGIAGMVAALAVAESGLSVVVLERQRETRYLNATRMCGGVFHCCLRDPRTPPEDLAKAIGKATAGVSTPARVDAIAHNALRTIRWLQARDVRFMKSGPARSFVLAPPNVSRRGLDWQGRSGDVLLRNLETRMQALGGEVRRGHQVDALIMKNGRCVGLDGIRKGKPFQMFATHTMIADGGFQSDPELLETEITGRHDALLQRNGRSGLGFGLRTAKAAGANISSLKGFYGHLQTRDAKSNELLWPYPWWDDVAAEGIVVDGHGRRFCDEGRGGIYIANRVAELPDPDSAFVIFDDAIWNSGGLRGQIAANPNFVRAGATIHFEESLTKLAHTAGLDRDLLAASVAEHNQKFGAGVDVKTSAGTPRLPIAKPPYFAAPVCAGITYAMGGILTDHFGRVLDQNDAPFPGLYAAGSTTGGLEGGESVGYVGGLIKSAVMGLLGAEHVISLGHRGS